MHRMIQSNRSSLLVAATAFALCATIGVLPAEAAPPSVRHANVDYEASGYVTPAGMVPPSMYEGGVMPVGFVNRGQCDGACDSPGTCDGFGSCGDPGCGSGIFDGGSSSNSCGGNCGGQQCGIFGCGGVLGNLSQRGTACDDCGRAGCGFCGGLSKLRHCCLFCRGGGCSACQSFKCSNLLGAIYNLRPYSEAGLCAQRWYDLSAEAVFLSHSNGGLRGDVTSLGVAPLGPIVLRLGDADGGNDIEAGMRLSASFIFGAGGNIEGTYMGGNEWNSQASVSDPAAGLFSFISDFGTNPGGSPAGFDDTDRSLVQSVASDSEFHSGELNYRRRTMGPFCRFQGSWLIGLRYLRFENGLLYSALGENNNAVNASLPRFFSSDDQIKNNLFGPQAGFDLWWNMTPGINLGIGMKGAWVQNDIDRRTTLTANSLILGSPGTAVISDKAQDTTIMGEFEAKLAYRLSHSWTFRSAYYAIAADDIAFGTADRQTIRDFVTANPLSNPGIQVHSLVVQGVSFGAEYIW